MRSEQRIPGPDPAFDARLESQIVTEVRRRNRERPAPRWSSWTRGQLATAAGVVALVSASLGGAAVATAYEVQQGQMRDQIAANIEQRRALAQLRVDLATKDQQFEQRKFDVGMSDVHSLLEKGLDVSQAQAQLNRLTLDLEEVRASGREPRTDLSAPRVSGRDFVGERLQVDLRVPVMQLDVAQRLARDIQIRIEIGTLAQPDADIANNRIAETESLRQQVVRKLEIRRQFLDGRLDSTETELRALEADAEHKLRSLGPRITVARAEVARLNQRAAAGVASLVEVAEAKVRQSDLEAALSKAELDVMVVRQRIKDYRR